MPNSTFFLPICFYSEVYPQKHGKCRNQAIVDIFQYMHIVEAWGTGTPRVITSCKQYGLQEPVFEEFGDGIKATVYRLQANSRTSEQSNKLERRFDKIVPVRTQQTLILVGYSRELGITGKYAEAIEYAQQGVDICLKYGVYQNLPALLMILAECFYQVGYTEKSKELFTESFYLCKVVRDEVNKNIAADSLKEYFQIQIN
ncbi:ATP-binding protein [Butyrivibrio sp. XBB1001]|uniref:ATP-binding protein n=1 Tax=Butyrivibrio sp. XBB1001 TaxID=1280682 RepID=UPI00047A0835|nr:ATP-binding protein [Butyrivibrio sp. XBB1001]